MRFSILIFSCLLGNTAVLPIFGAQVGQSPKPATIEPSSDVIETGWWSLNNLRVMQVNLPEYEATLDVDCLMEDLERFSVNTLIINAGGIMAFYPSQLDFEYVNPYMQPDMLADVVSECHQRGIRVITRFDFSRIHESIYQQHPDWAYQSADGRHITNGDLYVTSVNAPYVQEKSMQIIREVMTLYPIDGIFINMPGYATRNAYEGGYYGIDHNLHDAKRFADYSGGLELPETEDPSDPTFQKYLEFKDYTVRDWGQKIHKTVKSINPEAAICTYTPEFVDIIRHESQSGTPPYWPYGASEHVNNVTHSHPGKIVSNASIQQLSFRSRFNAAEPPETAIRLWQNLANGSGLDMSMMGDFREYEDMRNYETWERIYRFHKDNEPFYGNYRSVAQICVIAPGNWPGGESAEEFRGIQLMLKESHLQFDIIDAAFIEENQNSIRNYRVILVPQITYLKEDALQTLRKAVEKGSHLIATNTTLIKQSEAIKNLFGATPIEPLHDGNGWYLGIVDHAVFERLSQQSLVSWKYNLGFYKFDEEVKTLLPILTPGRPGPPEKTGGHEPNGYFAVGIHPIGSGSATLIPASIGRNYFLRGYQQYKNILLDIIDYADPSLGNLINTDAPDRIELVLKQYTENTPTGRKKDSTNGLILHAINLTGFSGNTYFDPIPVQGIEVELQCEFHPSKLQSLNSKKQIDYQWNDGTLSFTIPEITDYEAVVILK